MAQKQLTIKNNKGQALTETVFMLVMSGMFLYFILRCLMTVIFTVALDSITEDYFYCELADKPGCRNQLEQRLLQNQMRDIKISTENSSQKIILSVSATHLTSVTIIREFDYAKFKQKF